MNRPLVLLALFGALSLITWSCVDPTIAGDACDASGGCRAGLRCCEGFCRVDCGGGGGGGALDGGSGGGGGQVDAGLDDAGTADAGVDGGGTDDAGAPDAGTTDAGSAVDCDALAVRYGLAVDAAKVCNPNSFVEPCTEARPSAIVCGCPTSINAGSGGPLDALEAEFLDAGCLPTACPRCVVFDGGSCTPVSGGGPNDGVCVDLR